MNNKYYLAVVITMLSCNALADETLSDSCLQTSKRYATGTIEDVSLEKEKGRDTYEFNVISADGTKWELKCDRETAVIFELEREFPNADHSSFAALKKVDETEARNTALNYHPGIITKVEYEIEKDGTAVYEFKIKTRDGEDVEVEIDATTGKLVKEQEH